MWKSFWISLSNQRGQIPAESDPPPTDEGSSDTTERAAEPDDWGVRQPYDSATPDVADSVSSEVEEKPAVAAAPATGEQPYLQELNLDPSTFTPEMQEVFKRMQAAHTKKMQKFKSYEGHLQNMEKFYNDKSFAEQTLRQWAQQHGYSVVPSQFNNQPAASQPPEGSNALQHKVVEALKSKLPAETQWMADGHGSAIFEVMKEVLGPVLQEFQGFKTAKEEHEWKTLESEYDTTESEFAAKHPGWEAHEDEMSSMLSFLTDTKAYRHPVYGSKHELLYKLVTGNAKAVKEATDRIAAAAAKKTPSSTPGRKVAGSGFNNVQDEIAATPDKNDAFAKAATAALQQVRRRR